ncbi:hypothetical protein JR316_0001727 [Psilocybe cubensis]|uniref:OsmC-like protein n=2 Tax=Psilocybe cubensis TaxID=181762 RepID=A0A8H8CPL4_PSICU|nr:hypothetical protein JR316_0001727 [Psilocybe cubensis]KAH9484825.1 hypothetical protein JR316_0001727 [Psilocybe cubensis]
MFAPAARSLLATSVRASANPKNAFNKVYGSARTVVTVKTVKYTATARAQGAGRNGTVKSGNLDLKLASPKELGGDGKGENPEQLLAMGYSACFLGAVQLLAKKQGKEEMAKAAQIVANVSLGESAEKPGFGLTVDIQAVGIDEELAQAAHEFCPFSRALTQGAVVNVSVSK